MIDLDLPVYQTLQDHPEILDLLVDLGFKPLKNPMMVNSLGKVTSLRQGASLIQLDLNDLITSLDQNGYLIKGVTDSD